MNIKKLDTVFNGSGEVSGLKFTQFNNSGSVYLYEVRGGDMYVHYEVFKAKTTPLCIDFGNRVFSETEFKHMYPKSRDFGSTAWTFNDIRKATEKYGELKKQNEL